jgi:hypothetical protein
VSESQTEPENQDEETTPKMLELEEGWDNLLSMQDSRAEKVSQRPDPDPPTNSQQDWMTFESRKENMDPGRSSGQETQEEGSCEDLWSLKNLWLERETQELEPSAYTEHEIAGGELVRVRRENMDPGGQNKRAEHFKESLPSAKKYWTPTVTWRRTREAMAIKSHAQWNFR